MSAAESGERHKILFRLEKDAEGWPPAEVEGIWAKHLTGDEYQVDNIPFFVCGLSLGDDVAVRHVGEERRFERLVRSHGHRTIRVVVFDEKRVPNVRAELRRLGCSTELSHLPRLIAVDIPPGVKAVVIRRWMEDAIGRNEIDVEEGAVDW